MKRIGALSGMRWLMLVLVFQAGYTAVVAAQEIDELYHYWTGRIEQDTTWRDTVYVSGDVTIASGATLTLAPDTQVHFLPYCDDTQGGLDSTRAELIVEGRLHAQAEGIVFCSANAASLGADWYGIVIERGGLADVSHATIRDGLRCLDAEMGGRVTMNHIAFANCGKPSRSIAEQHSAAKDEGKERRGRYTWQKVGSRREGRARWCIHRGDYRRVRFGDDTSARSRIWVPTPACPILSEPLTLSFTACGAAT